MQSIWPGHWLQLNRIPSTNLDVKSCVPEILHDRRGGGEHQEPWDNILHCSHCINRQARASAPSGLPDMRFPCRIHLSREIRQAWGVSSTDSPLHLVFQYPRMRDQHVPDHRLEAFHLGRDIAQAGDHQHRVAHPLPQTRHRGPPRPSPRRPRPWPVASPRPGSWRCSFALLLRRPRRRRRPRLRARIRLALSQLGIGAVPTVVVDPGGQFRDVCRWGW